MRKEKALCACADQGRPQSRPPIPPPLPPTHERPFKPAAGSQAKPDQAAQSHTAQPAEALSTDGQLRKQEKKSKVQNTQTPHQHTPPTTSIGHGCSLRLHCSLFSSVVMYNCTGT